MKHYSLFLDESMVDGHYFSVAGIIVDKSQQKSVKKQLLTLKEDLWSPKNYPQYYSQTHSVTYYPIEYRHDFILHEMVVNQINNLSRSAVIPKFLNKNGEQYIIFRENRVVSTLYQRIAKILDTNNIPITGVVFDFDRIHNLYKVLPPIDSGYEMAIQILIENFVQFLIQHNAYGDIVLESRRNSSNNKADLLLQSKFFYIKARGTMFLPDQVIQRHLGNITFVPKKNNSACLQIADFVPNNFARKMAGKNTHRLGRTLLNHRYDGKVKQPDRFGIKQIP